MQFQVNTVQVRDVINRIIHIVEARAELEAFREVTMKIHGDKLYFATTMPGAEATEFLLLPEKMKGKALLTGIPAKTFQSVLNSITTDTMTFTLTEEHLLVSSGRSRFRLSRRQGDAVLFPNVAEQKLSWDPFDVKSFAQSCRRVAAVTSKDGSRPYFSVVHITPEEMVATDGRVLALSEPPFKTPLGGVDLSGEHLNRLIRVLPKTGEGEVAFTDTRSHFRVGSLFVSMVMASLAYPNYQGMVLRRFTDKEKITLERKAFHSIVSQMAILSADSQHKIRLVQLSPADGGISFSSTTAIGDSESFLEGPSFNMGVGSVFFDVDLLLKGISSFEHDKVEVIVEAVNRPAMFSEPGYVFFINPVRFSKNI